MNIDAPISDEEHASHESSSALLTSNFSNSSFAALQKRYSDFKDTVDEVTKAFAEKRATPQMAELISTCIDDFLTSLRRFADRTAHALSEQYGKESSEYAAFTEALSFDFDNSFPYRFAYHLRNYCDHRGSVPFHIKEDSGLGPDGSVQRLFRVVLNGQTLLDNHEWHSMVRSDLERISGDFSVVAVIDGVRASCMRAYCKMLLAQESSIVSAMANIRDFASKADPPADCVPVFIRAPKDVSSPLGTVHISPISIEMADVADTALKQARATVS